MYQIISSHITAIFQFEYVNSNTEDNLELMIKYYHTLDDSSKKLFREQIFEYLKNINDDIVDFHPIKIRWKGLLYIKLAKYLWIIKQIIESTYINNNFYYLLIGFEDILSSLDWEDANIYAQKLMELIMNLDISSFSNREKDRIADCMRGVGEEIIQRKVGNIKLKVNQVDVEIQSDQNEVVKLIQEFGFKSDLNEYLTGLSSKNISEEDEMTFAWTIATYREFFWNMMIEISDKIVEIGDEVIWNYYDEQKKKIVTPIWIARKHIEDRLSLSSKDNALINKYVDILHDQWWHNMFASQIYFRLTKNIWIEILYMLLSKLKELEK